MSIDVKLPLLQHLISIDIILTQNLSFFCMELNMRLAPVFSKFDLAILKLGLFLYSEALAISLFLVYGLSVFDFGVSVIHSVKLHLVVLTPFPLLIFKSLQEAHLVTTCFFHGRNFPGFFVDEGLLHNIHDLLDVLRVLAFFLLNRHLFALFRCLMLANDLLEYVLAFAECLFSKVVPSLAHLVFLQIHILNHLPVALSLNFGF